MTQMSPLRRRMIDDMTIRNLSPATQRSYLHAVQRFSGYFGRSPDRLDLEDVRTYQVHLAGKGVSWGSLNRMRNVRSTYNFIAVSATAFSFNHVGGVYGVTN